MKALLDADTSLVTIVGKTWDLHVREILGTTLEENLAMIADSVAFCEPQAARSSTTPSTSSTAITRNPDYALATLAPPRTGRRHGARPVRHQRRHAARGGRRRRRRRPPRTARPRSASTATTTATWPSPTRWPPSRRRDPGAGDDQRHRRTLRQRRPRQRHRQPGAEARLRGAAAGQPASPDGGVALRLRDGEHELPARPAVRRLAAPSPTRAACTSTPSTSSPPATSTSTRPSSATSGASSSASCPVNRPSWRRRRSTASHTTRR